jgi:hypothetical protein
VAPVLRRVTPAGPVAEPEETGPVLRPPVGELPGAGPPRRRRARTERDREREAKYDEIRRLIGAEDPWGVETPGGPVVRAQAEPAAQPAADQERPLRRALGPG